MIKGILQRAEQIGHKLGGGAPKTKASAADSKGYVTFEIKPYKENELGFSHWQGFLANFSSISETIYFSIRGNKSSIRLFLHVPAKYQKYVENVFYSSFPTTDLTLLDVEISTSTTGHQFFKFSPECEFYDYSEFSKGGSYVDPFKDVLSSYLSVPDKAELVIQYSNVFDIKDGFWKKWIKKINKILGLLSGKGWRKSKTEVRDEKNDEEIKKVTRDVSFGISMHMTGTDETTRIATFKDMKNVYDKFLHEGSISLVKSKQSAFANMSQFVNLFHVPTKANQNASLHYTEYRKLAAPVNIPTRANTEKNMITLLGTTDYKGRPMKFGIRKEDKFRHIYIVGKTGMGKSTFISNMVRSDMITNQGLAVIDPHGDLIEDVMAHIPSRRTNDVVLFDVSDMEHPVGFNILQYKDASEKNLVVSGMMAVFARIWEGSWSSRMEYILRNVLMSVIEYPNATLMHVIRMMTDDDFRKEVLSHVTDAVVLKFWYDEYDKWQDRYRSEAVAPIINKIGQFLSSPIVRNIFGQPQSKMSLREAMDEGKIILINLSKGKIGEDNASMIGSFLVTKFQIDAMSRADMDFKNRRDFYLYIDEFQNFATDSFASILSEARKYRLSLIVANQFTSQIQENVRDAIFGNVGTIVSFGLGYDDATIMSSQFKEIVTPNDLLSLPKFKAYVKLMVDGITTDSFSMGTFPLPEPAASAEIKEKIRIQSRQRYSMEREKLEKLLKVWAEKKFSESEKIEELSKQEGIKPDGSKFTAEDIVLNEWYQGYVKLIYNYGIFVTVKGIDGLLHKSQVDVPANLPPDQWKDYYTPGDKIKVRADSFKLIEGDKKVVWSQLEKK